MNFQLPGDFKRKHVKLFRNAGGFMLCYLVADWSIQQVLLKPTISYWISERSFEYRS